MAFKDRQTAVRTNIHSPFQRTAYHSPGTEQEQIVGSQIQEKQQIYVDDSHPTPPFVHPLYLCAGQKKV